MNLKKNLARAMTAAMMMSTIAAFTPAASAADVINASDTMTRLEAAVSADHTITFTLPASWEDGDGNIVITFDTFDFSESSAAVSGCSGTDPASLAETSTGVITLDDASVSCTSGDELTVTGFSATNPAAGSYTYTFSGAFTGQGSVVTIADDTITVNATVEPTIAFLAIAMPGTSTCNNTVDLENETADYVVDLGALELASITVSKDLNADNEMVDLICTQGSTNATGGMAVTIKNANGANGLVSSSVTADTIPSTTASGMVLAGGTPGYGICINPALTHDDGLTPSGTAPTSIGDYATWDCDDSAGEVVGLSTTAETAWSATGPTQDATAEFVVRAAISATQPAHNDYTDSLTFVATGTF
jgi:hypothetical protein